MQYRPRDNPGTSMLCPYSQKCFFCTLAGHRVVCSACWFHSSREQISQVSLWTAYRYAYVWCSYRKPELFICDTVFCTFPTQCRKGLPQNAMASCACNVANVFFVGLGRNVAIVSFALTLASQPPLTRAQGRNSLHRKTAKSQLSPQYRKQSPPPPPLERNVAIALWIVAHAAYLTFTMFQIF